MPLAFCQPCPMGTVRGHTFPPAGLPGQSHLRVKRKSLRDVPAVPAFRSQRTAKADSKLRSRKTPVGLLAAARSGV